MRFRSRLPLLSLPFLLACSDDGGSGTAGTAVSSDPAPGPGASESGSAVTHSSPESSDSGAGSASAAEPATPPATTAGAPEPPPAASETSPMPGPTRPRFPMSMAGAQGSNMPPVPAASGGAPGPGGGGAASAQGGATDVGGTGGASSGAGGTGAGGADPGACVPDYECQPVAPDTGDFYADCVARVNQFRECVCLPPLERNFDAEACLDQQAQYDSDQDVAHAGFSDSVCMPRGNSQNECPGWRDARQVVDGCIQMMFDEGPPPQDPCEGQCYQDHGHFINMTDTRVTMVACGAYDGDNGYWSVQNFFR